MSGISQDKRTVIEVPQTALEEVLRLLDSAGVSVGKIHREGERVELSLVTLPDDSLTRIMLLHSDAVISKYSGRKKGRLDYSLPKVITGLLVCTNKNCVTAFPKEPTTPRFTVVSIDPPKVTCHYCGRYIPRDSLTAQLRATMLDRMKRLD